MNKKNSKFTQNRLRICNHLLAIACTYSFLLPESKAIASVSIPSVGMSTFDLSISHDECKAKATKVASLVLAEYAAEESNNIFSLKGRTSSSRALLVCMKKDRGVHFVLITSSNNFESEYETILNRIGKFMKS